MTDWLQQPRITKHLVNTTDNLDDLMCVKDHTTLKPKCMANLCLEATDQQESSLRLLEPKYMANPWLAIVPWADLTGMDLLLLRIPQKNL